MLSPKHKDSLLIGFSWLLIFVGLAFFLLSFGPLIHSELWYLLKQATSQKLLALLPNDVPPQDTGEKQSVFGRLLQPKPILLDPLNKDFSIIIEKIGVNAPVVANVSIASPQAYAEALKNGVAHAINSGKPSKEPGNVYIFAHASLNFWKLGKYATTFNLLRKLSIDDRVIVYYKGAAYIYNVVNIERYPGWNTYPIERPVIEPILTLQTCDPPGTTLNRLVVTAKLVEIR